MNYSQPISGFVDGDGVRLHFLQWGNAGEPALVLVHGTASHAWVWSRFAPAFADSYHVIAIDQRGHGDSESPRDRLTGYARDIWVRDLHRVVDSLDLAPITLIGVSAGGNTATHFAANFPEAVSRLVVVEMGPEAARAGVDRVISSIPSQEEFDSLEAGVNYLTRAGGRSDPELGRIHAVHALRQESDGRFVLKGDAALRSRDWRRPLRTHEENWAAVRAVKCPTLLIRGAESKLLAPETAEQVQREMLDCTLVTIEGAGHAVPLHRPAEFEAEVKHWLSARG